MIRNSLFALLLLAGSGAAQAQQLGSCNFHMPKETRTIVYGAYQGGLDSAVKLVDREGSGKVGRVEVKVPKTDEPLFLVMTAYRPVEWDLQIENGARIAGLLVMGYYEQVVKNLPEQVQFGFSTIQNGHGLRCPKPILAHDRSSAEYVQLTDMLSSEFSRRVNAFYGDYQALCLYRGCTVTKPPSRSMWSALFASDAEPARLISSGPIE
jgi:hypothetical protein